MVKKVTSVALIVIGVIAIILAVVCFSMRTGTTPSNQTYGGDAYTGIQNASAAVARNVAKTNEVLKLGFGSLLLVSGLVIGCCGVKGLLPEKELYINAENNNQYGVEWNPTQNVE